VAAVAIALLLPAAAGAGRPSQRLLDQVAPGGFVTDERAIPVGVGTHPFPSDRTLHLTVTLRPSDPAGLGALLDRLADPSSGEYRQFLSYGDFTSRFSPAPSTGLALQTYLAAFGAHGFQLTPDRFALSFAIPAGGATRALGVSFVSLGPGASAYTALGAPHLPAALARSVAAVSGLSGAAGPRAATEILSASPPKALGPTPNAWVANTAVPGQQWFLGSDFASAYHVSSLFPPSAAVANATFPNRTAIATILMSGYNATNDTDLPPYDPVVVQAYYNDTFPTSWAQPNVSGVPVNVSGVTPPVPGYFHGVNDSTANSVENSLDLEMAGSMAPGATLVNFYFSGSLFSSPRYTESIGAIADGFADCLSAALAHNYSPARLAVVSGSFGLTDLNDTLWNSELELAAATGVTVVSASGDQGDAPSALSGRFQGQWPSWPASAAFDSYGTISVGGTTVLLDGSATQIVGSNDTLNASFDPTVTGIQSQSVWFDTLAGYGNISGSEGGISSVFPEPSWQFRSAAQPTIVNATLDQGFGSLGRAEPDVAFAANTTIAYVARDPGGIYYEVVEGTSIAAPLFAGLVATWSAVSGHRFGYLDPELYRIASYYQNATAAPLPAPSTDPFLEVTQGSNYVFAATPGWNAATGWGGLDAVLFLQADANATVRNYLYTGPTPGLPPPLAVTPGTFDEYLILIVGIAIAGVVVVVITYGARRPAPPPGYGYPPGTVGGQWSPETGYSPPGGPLPASSPGDLGRYPPGAPTTFLCPYCGAPRPAEPTRCPACGRL